jgi:transmembrane sensor
LENSELYHQFLNGKCNSEELDQLFRYFGTASEAELKEMIIVEMENSKQEPITEVEQKHLKRLHGLLTEQLFKERKSTIRLWPRIAAAASIIIAVSSGTYFILHKNQPAQQTAENRNDVPPGSNKAILKMANGKQVVITGAKNGLLAQQGSTTITKTADGKLTYANSGNNNSIMLYDTLIVPRGGQHQIKFSDGSIAFLNADSKLRIPENFEKSDRTVELISGEADFHVVHNAKSPFRVKVKGQITQDIGTEFNINAYPDEAIIKTTLLEGAVRVSSNNRSSILKPGQQAAVNPSSNTIRVYNVDTDEAFAWKNGKFMFSSTRLEDIMRQLSRWYDVEVVYQDDSIKQKQFSAISTRFANASQVLHDLELTGEVKFKIEGKRITVLKNKY